MDYINYYDSPLGRIMLASDGYYLKGLWFEGQKYFAAGISGFSKRQSLPVFDMTYEWLDIYFSGNAPDFTPPLLINTSEFRRKVWNILLEIPYGGTMTYKGISEIIALQYGKNRMSAQAVGNAVAHNPISLIIPCHRVVGSDGSLKGYAGGLNRKKQLLLMEKHS